MLAGHRGAVGAAGLEGEGALGPHPGQPSVAVGEEGEHGGGARGDVPLDRDRVPAGGVAHASALPRARHAGPGEAIAPVRRSVTRPACLSTLSRGGRVPRPPHRARQARFCSARRRARRAPAGEPGARWRAPAARPECDLQYPCPQPDLQVGRVAPTVGEPWCSGRPVQDRSGPRHCDRAPRRSGHERLRVARPVMPLEAVRPLGRRGGATPRKPGDRPRHLAK